MCMPVLLWKVYLGVQNVVIEGVKYDTIQEGFDVALYTVRNKARALRKLSVRDVYPPYDTLLEQTCWI